MHRYSTDHTGAKILSGGVHGGKSIFLYQVLVAFAMIGTGRAPPTACPTAQHASTPLTTTPSSVFLDLSCVLILVLGLDKDGTVLTGAPND
mmetsp:Transcript_2359/g.2552  ORF Transcript_2359/g.2552 Transcript_2359/m.2552 type:complete len:91 (-) Transcript_2359:80-352(-)